MKLSTKGRYAVEAMMDLALHSDKGPVTLADISVDQGISLSYLEQLFARLRAYGLVHGMRGPGGGYRLARPATEISVADIITAVDDKARSVHRNGDEADEGDLGNMTHRMWANLSERIFEFLDGITLAEFLDQKEMAPPVKQQHPEHFHSHKSAA